MRLATYHNHTTWSDGKASVGEVIDAARRMNIADLGISDHWVLHPQGKTRSWAMPADHVGSYVEELRHYQNQSRAERGPNVRIGLEVDWFPGHGDAIRDALLPFEFDYLIGSVHEVDGFLVDMSPAAWEKLSPAQREHVHRRYWINMRSLAESGLFHIAAHLDLTKKFGFYPAIDPSREIGDALDALAGAGTIIELNTAGWHKPCDDAYPSLDILREAKTRDIGVTISADAHLPEHLLRDFDRGAARLRQAGFTHIARFARGEVTFEPLNGSENADERSAPSPQSEEEKPRMNTDGHG